MGIGRKFLGLLLAVNFVGNLILLGLTAWSLDKYIGGHQNHPHLGGNTATIFLLVYSLLAGVMGVYSVIVGFAHLRVWKNESLVGASVFAITAFDSTVLPFVLVCKQIAMGGYRG